MKLFLEKQCLTFLKSTFLNAGSRCTRYTRIPKIKKESKVLAVRTHKNLNEASLLDDFHNLPIKLILESSGNPDTLWLIWKSFFINILNKHAPVKTIRVRGNSLPYVTAEVKHMKRTRDKLRSKANKTGSVYLRQAFQQMRNKVNYTLRKLRSDYYTRKIEENKNNLRNTWKTLKSVMNETSTCSSIEKIMVHNTEITNKQQISNEMNKFFATIGQNLAKIYQTILLTQHAWSPEVIEYSNLEKFVHFKCMTLLRNQPMVKPQGWI